LRFLQRHCQSILFIRRRVHVRAGDHSVPT
jgi:hypothetical protein